MTLRFNGEYDELKRMVDSLKFTGEWSESENPTCVQFRTKDGAILNWFPTTGTINFQGPEPAKSRVAAKVRIALSSAEDADQESEVDSGSDSPTIARPSKDLAATKGAAQKKKVFVVHGHDDAAREQLELVLHKLGLDPFVLANTGGGGNTIIEALEEETGPGPGRARFGIVLLTPDDIGYAKKQSPADAQPRARQNVVLEMGMLIAALGRENVAILKKGHLEIPSDVQGIIYLPFNDHVKETVPKLVDRLRDAGFELDPKAISKASV